MGGVKGGRGGGHSSQVSFWSVALLHLQKRRRRVRPQLHRVARSPLRRGAAACRAGAQRAVALEVRALQRHLRVGGGGRARRGAPGGARWLRVPRSGRGPTRRLALAPRHPHRRVAEAGGGRAPRIAAIRAAGQRCRPEEADERSHRLGLIRPGQETKRGAEDAVAGAQTGRPGNAAFDLSDRAPLCVYVRRTGRGGLSGLLPRLDFSTEARWRTC